MTSSPKVDVIDYSSAFSVLPSLDSVYGGMFQDSVMYLCITDPEFLRISRNLFPVELAPGKIYGKLLGLWYEYWDRFKSAPTEQIEVELNWAKETKLLTEEEYSSAVEYQNKLSGMEPPNKYFVLAKLEEFCLQRKWFVTGVEFVKKVRSGQLEEARSIISKSLREGVTSTLDSGINIFDPDKVVDRVMRRNVATPYLMKWMIKPFDDFGIVLYRGDYILIAAPEKKGKSWAGIHVGKAALLQGLNILHCSQGDLYEGELEDRYDQCFTSSFHWRQKPSRKYNVKWFEPDENDRKRSNLVIGTVAVESIKDLDTVRHGVKAVKEFGGKLVIKWWAMGTCTMQMFEGYLDHLAVNENFVPDVIINDYGEIMALSSNDRAGIDEMNMYMRRVSGEHKTLVINFSQVNKKAYSKKWISMGDFSEDKRKAAHCSGAYALCRTLEEEKNGTGRFVLFVDRHFGKTGFCSEMVMDYSIGQFCKSARLLPKVEEKEGGE